MLRSLKAPKLLQRIIATLRDPDAAKRWLVVIRAGRPGSELLVTVESFERACARLVAGQMPPLLPSEKRREGEKDLMR